MADEQNLDKGHQVVMALAAYQSPRTHSFRLLLQVEGDKEPSLLLLHLRRLEAVWQGGGLWDARVCVAHSSWYTYWTRHMAEMDYSTFLGTDVLIGMKYRKDLVDSYNYNLLEDRHDDVINHHHVVVGYRSKVVAAIGHSNEVEAALGNRIETEGALCNRVEFDAPLGNRIEVDTAVGDRSEVVDVVCHHPIQDSDREPD